VIKHYHREMAGAMKRDFSGGVKRFGLPKLDISGYADMSLDEQITALSELIMENQATAIYKVWSELDQVDRSIVMWRLGCFDGENAPQLIYAQREQSAREFLADVRKQKSFLAKVIARQAEHERTASGLGFRSSGLHFTVQRGPGSLSSTLEGELARLPKVAAVVKRHLVQSGKWDVKGIVIAQEYVNRRLKFLGVSDSISLNYDAISEVMELIQPPLPSSEYDTRENIRKAIERFRGDDDNEAFFKNIESLIPYWERPLSIPETR
jgi:hypothetical protein